MASLAGANMNPVTALALVALLGTAGCGDTHANEGQSKPPAPSTPATSAPSPGAPSPKAPEAKPETLALTISGKTFTLELAITDAVRQKGLGQRDKIDEKSGMLFVFGEAQKRAFVMRDCPIDIDIIYLDGAGRIVSFYEMKAEPPRGEGEGKVGDVNNKYEARLKKWDSRFPTQFVVELKGGTIPSLGLKVGQAIKGDWEGLKKRVK